MHTGLFWQIIYWFSTVALAILGWLLIRRKLSQAFPFFLTYVIVSLLGELAGKIVYGIGTRVYYYTYWIAHLVDAVFIFLATYELFIRHLFPRFHKLKFYRYLFFIAALAIIGLAIPTVLGAVKVAVLGGVIRIVDFLQVAILFFFVGLMTFMGREWGQYELGIALGLSVDAAVFLITFAIFIKSGALHGLVRELPVLGEDAASFIWLVCFLRPEKMGPAPTLPTGIIDETKKWRETVKGSIIQKKGPL